MASSVHAARNAMGKASMGPLLVVPLALAMIVATPAGFGAVATRAQTDQLAFVAETDRTPQIFLINTDGTGRRRLTGPAGRSTTPVWSPDGRQIAFVRQLGDDSQIYVMTADGRSTRPLTRTPGTRTSPAWSPDGRQIVFVSASHGLPQIVLMRSDGTEQHALTRPPGERHAPAWSPDGRWIAFLSKGEHAYFELYVTHPDGGGLRRVATPSPGVQPDVKSFVWTPNGRLTYTSRSGPAQEAATVTSIDGAEQRYLGSASEPAWAPDGQHLAFVASHSGEAQIYVQSTNEGSAVRLSEPHLTSVRPAWSPDSRHIAYLVLNHGVTTLTVISADGRDRRALASVYGDLSALPVFSWRP